MNIPQQQPSLTSIPSELVAFVFGNLRSLSDVFALATTCRALRAVWFDNTTSIFERVGLDHHIEYLTLARSLLADQGGAPISSAVLSHDDVRRMVRNARKVDKSADRFGREVAARAPSDGFYYTPPDHSRSHPPYLTSTERPRFVRAYYRAWGLLELDNSAWQDRFKHLTQRQLYRTGEIANLPQPFGEEIGPDLEDLEFPCPNWNLKNIDFPHPAYYPIPNRRWQLSHEMYCFATKKHRDRFPNESNCPHFSYYTTKKGGSWGCAGIVTLFDHFTETVWYAMRIDIKAASASPDYRKYIREEIWGESSDEEAYRPKRRVRQKNQGANM